MSEDLKEKLLSEVARVQWEMLIPEAARGRVVLVHHSVDFLEAALAIATDQSDKVQVWIDGQLLSRVSDEELARLNAAKETELQMVVVAPYVVCQEISGSPVTM